jgi:hypothetical protein
MSDTMSDEDLIPGLLPDSPASTDRVSWSGKTEFYAGRYAAKFSYGLRSIYRIVGFAALNLLAVLGLVIVFFIMIGGGRPQGFFTQVMGIAKRFTEASSERQADFLIIMSVVVLALFILLSALRSNILRDGLGRSV